MQDTESDYARRDEISLPRDLRAAKIDKEALASLGEVHAKATHCLLWRRTETTLTALLPASMSEEEWADHELLVRQQLERYESTSTIVFRSSGLERADHLDVIAFFYKRAASNISCVNMFEFVCPMKWFELEPTADPYARHCNQCQRDVHLVANEKEFENRASAGDCVAYIPPTPWSELEDSLEPELPPELEEMFMVGQVAPPSNWLDEMWEPPPTPTAEVEEALPREYLDEESSPSSDDHSSEQTRPPAPLPSPKQAERKWWDVFGLFGKK